MPKPKTPSRLPPDSVERILAAARRSRPHDPALIDGLGRWLNDGLERAIDRASAKPLTKGDVNKLDRAYLRFHHAVQALQDRRNPPPLIPVSDCETDWGYWIASNLMLSFKRGRREIFDWHLIGELIAFYEIVSTRRASASQPSGPTMCFLEMALSELADHVPAEMRSYFQSPGAGVLKDNLGVLQEGYFKYYRDELSDLIANKGAVIPSK
jgi:hypothetical protein